MKTGSVVVVVVGKSRSTSVGLVGVGGVRSSDRTRKRVVRERRFTTLFLHSLETWQEGRGRGRDRTRDAKSLERNYRARVFSLSLPSLISPRSSTNRRQSGFHANSKTSSSRPRCQKNCIRTCDNNVYRYIDRGSIIRKFQVFRRKISNEII